MVTVEANTITNGDIMSKIKNDIDKLTRENVYVGVPEEKSPRQGEPVSNAQLAYLHTNGSELQNIPSRPFIEPVISKNKDKIGDMMKKAGETAMSGGDSHTELERVGLQISTKVKDYFTDPNNGWPPNSLETVARKGSDKPLIDTSSLRSSITFVVGDK